MDNVNINNRFGKYVVKFQYISKKHFPVKQNTIKEKKKAKIYNSWN